ncbi:amyloid-beta precursor-like protein [Watersipora subatra]|uniref:amyloid-beta precursor-like protein n=1 Tax=Watersipora subatra TaxID=2589382 RepID=UPI00355C4F1A
MKPSTFTMLMFFTLLYFVGALELHNTAYDPMVAFVCNKGAMHMDPTTGWTIDPFANCLEEKSSILAYCQRTYPGLDIRNVVETTNEMTIKGWCPLGTSDCKYPDTFTVQAYRCLAGAFQSDVLVVPDACEFEHTQPNHTCKGFNYWSSLATTSCANQNGLVVHSFGTLLPCGTDLWSGVEYVCCPPGEEESEKDDAIDKYLGLKLIGGLYNNEHDAYELAKHRQAEMNKEKSSKLMEEWYAARARVVEMQKSDPQGAEEMNKEISERFSKEYEALRYQENNEMGQLDTVHQQHVQLNLNSKKSIAMQKLMEELQSNSHDSDDLFTLLQNYILIEQKDAAHCVKHFVKVRARDSNAARPLLPTTIEHLTLISMRINQSIELFDTLLDRRLADRLKTNIARWVTTSSFSIEETLSLLKELPEAKPIDEGEELRSSLVKAVTGRPPLDAETTKLSHNFVPSHRLPVTNERGDDTPLIETSRKTLVTEEVGGAETESMTAASVNLQSWPLIAFLITFGVVTTLFTIFVVIVVVKRSKHRPKRRSHNYLEVSQSIHSVCPEDRHIVAMQNGYENPTYSLLEQKKL